MSSAPRNSPVTSPKRKWSTIDELADLPFLADTPIPKETTDWARVTFDTNNTAGAINNLLAAADKIVEERGGKEPAEWKEVELGPYLKELLPADAHQTAEELERLVHVARNPDEPWIPYADRKKTPLETLREMGPMKPKLKANYGACHLPECKPAPAETEEGEIQQPGAEFGPLVDRAEYSDLLQYTGCVINIAPPVGNIAAASGVFGGENLSGRKPWKSVIQADQAMTVDTNTFNILKGQLIRDFERGLEEMDNARASKSKVSRIHVIRK